jgi:hypothetical protein
LAWRVLHVIATTRASASSNIENSSRIWQSSDSHVRVNAKGMNTMTDLEPFRSSNDTGSRSWFSKVNSGAVVPMARVKLPFSLFLETVGTVYGSYYLR